MKKEFNIQKCCLVSILCLYAALTLWIVLHHEMWRDEAQKWLMVRELNLFELFAQLKYEGHPFLWFILIFPLAKLNLPYESIQILNWLIINIGVCVFVLTGKTKLIIKIPLIFSYLIAYEYAIISLNYSLIFTLLAIMVWVYPDRHKKIYLFTTLLFLLYNTHILVFGFCFALNLLLCYENYFERKSIKNTFISSSGFLISMVFIFFQFKRPKDAFFGHLDLSSVLQNTFKSLPDFIGKFFTVIEVNGSWFFQLLVFLALIFFFRFQLKTLILLMFSYGFIFIILHFVYNGYYRHYGLLFLLFIFLIEINLTQTSRTTFENFSKTAFYKNSYYALSFLIGFSLIKSDLKTIETYQKEYELKFTASKETASFINHHAIYDDYLLVGYPSFVASAIIPYLKRKTMIWYPEYERKGTFITWNKNLQNNMVLNLPEIISKLNKNKIQMAKCLFIIPPYLFDEDAKKTFIPIYQSEVSNFDDRGENYVVCLLK
jgi:hypothetical protein